MSKTLYFDAFNGVSGDMILGALIDLGLPLEHLREQLGTLPLEGYRLEARDVQRQGLRATDFRVVVSDSAGHAHSHAHGEHAHRSLTQIEDMIRASGLPSGVRTTAARIFRRLGEAEARVHGTPVEETHFHEVGALDSIVDIVGACIGFHYLGVERFFASTLALGGGTVSFSHGRWPVPAPATVELVRGLPVRPGPVDVELTTPTGAAVVAALAEPGRPLLRLERQGYGAGDRELPEIPNVLRLLLGEVEGRAVCEEEVVLLEASLDDMDGELLGNALEVLLEQGALDVSYSPLVMKKSRPGVLLSVLAPAGERDRMAELIFRHTTTLGLRWSHTRRLVLDREFRELETEWGPVRVKVARHLGRVVNLWPEYEDLRQIARRRNLPLKEVRQRVFERIGRVTT